MRRGRWIGYGVLTVLLGLPLALPRSGSEARAANDSEIRVGLVRSLFQGHPDAIIQMVMRPFKSLLEAQTGMKGVILTAKSGEQLGKQLKDSEVQLGVFHGIEFAWARQKNPNLRPLVIAVNGKHFLRACLVVRSDSRVNSSGDLKGKVVALPTRSRAHCRVFLTGRCSGGSCPKKFYSRVAEPPDTEDALDEVCKGHVDAAIVDAHELAAYREDKPGRANKIKILQQSEPFPCGVVAYHPGTISDAVLKRIRSGMLTARSSAQGRQFLEMCHLSSFEPVTEEYLESLDAIAKSYPPPEAE